MSSQNYANHTHRPRLTAVAFLCALISAAGFSLAWRTHGAPPTLLAGVAGLVGAVILLVLISRVYVTRLQDRIIRLEMRVRGAALLTPEQQRLLNGLDLRRTAALRFASDEELPDLLDRTVRESLTPDQIKRSVRNWVPDLDRT
jgi:hypothetical protein